MGHQRDGMTLTWLPWQPEPHHDDGNVMSESVTPSIVCHGGAWAIPDALVDRSRAGVKRAVKAGYSVLVNGGSAIDAVEAAVVVLEDDPVFDAGTGAVLNSAGEVEMDAIIMDGRNLSAGAVGCVQNIKNPVKLARMVMEKTCHTMLVGKGANAFARQMGVVEVSPDELVTEHAREELRTYLKFHSSVDALFSSRDSALSGHDTVGAVAVDKFGNVACATSTGGITAKWPGRVGDTPVIGSGGYCDNNIGAVSTTGHGEAISRVCLARHVTGLMELGLCAQEAAEGALAFLKRRVSSAAGVIVVDKTGNIGRHFITERMAWASLRNQTLHHGLEPGEDFTESLQ